MLDSLSDPNRISSPGFSIDPSKFGTQDKVLLQYAWDNSLVVLTKDKDFGELVFKARIPSKGSDSTQDGRC